MNPFTMFNEVVGFQKEAENISRDSANLKESVDLSYGLINHIRTKTEIFSKIDESEQKLLINLEKLIEEEVLKIDNIFKTIAPLMNRLQKQHEKEQENEKKK